MIRRFLLALSGLVCLGAPAAWLGAQGGPSEPVWRTGTWDAAAFGNHRVVVRVESAADAVRVRIPWRRRDRPAAKGLIIVEERTGNRLANIARIDMGREAADLAFGPVAAGGEFFVYYLPSVTAGSPNYPTVVYPRPSVADAAWLQRNQFGASELPNDAWKRLPEAQVLAIEAIDDFNRFDPMEVIATRAEVDALLAKHPGASLLVFPEDRRLAIRMTDDLPRKWIQDGAAHPFSGQADRGEFYAFQLGLYAARAAVANVQVNFPVLKGPSAEIPAAAFRCFNLGGVDWTGKPFTSIVDVDRGKIAPLWCGVQVPTSATPGTYRGTLRVSARGGQATDVEFSLDVSSRAIEAGGDNEPWRLSRLRWLDSTKGEDDSVIAPYEPVRVDGRRLSLLGRDVTLNAAGFPQRITSYFTPEMTGIARDGRDVLAAPIDLVVNDLDGHLMTWTGSPVRITPHAPGRASWDARRTSGPLAMDVHADLEFDGNIEFTVSLATTKPIALSDVRLEMPLARGVAKYVMGLGLKGGLRPESYDWTWDVKKNQDALWLGDINAGIQLSLKDEHYVRPLNTNFYLQKPLVMPVSWQNGGRGGCRFGPGRPAGLPAEKGEERGASSEERPPVLVTCYSGARMLLPGEAVRYDFRLLLTPFKPIDTRAQWTTRYYHRYTPLDAIAATGANTVNVHHATAVNPWINYPFLEPDKMKAYVDEAHAKGMKVKIYYTVRELSNHAPELFALFSLGHEIFSPGPGGGFSWLQEHLNGDYIAAWFVPDLKDAAVVNSGVSRWHNYYVEGLDWLVKHVGIDGLYIDDVAFDRLTMKRVRRVLDQRPGALIDLHSANQYNVRDGYASSANLYLEHFPYLSRLWFGEYFDYGSAPDYWLVEMSGIPFGLMGEMLQDGGNPWRGMVFGMTARLPWAGDPRPIWKAWDEFGLTDSTMVGWWAPGAPVRASDPNVLATTYRKNGRAMIAVASWAPAPRDVTLAIDWKALGLDPARVHLRAPAIDNFQAARTFAPGDRIPVAPGRGWLLIAE